MNRLFYGDNLHIMQERMGMHSVDLIYLDPPFKSDTNYNLMYKNMTGKPVPESVEAFFDTWELDAEKEKLARAMPVIMRDHGIDDYYVNFWKLWMDALRHTQPQLLAYLIYMVQRLLLMRSLLRPTGSIYLHCDPTASHYIKVMMDGIFGHQNFRNEIIWKRTFAHGGATRWGDIHDVILFYTASAKYTWNRVEQPYDEAYLETKYRHEDERGRYRLVVLTGPGVTSGASGKPWRGYDPTAAGRHWAVPQRAIEVLRSEGVAIPVDLHEQLELLYQHGLIRFPEKRDGSKGVPEFKLHLTGGQPIQDIITDVPPVNSQAKDRLGYPTQKPIALLDRIIQASSNPGDVVFDPFCGCGTTIYSAVKNGRQWIGCDIAILSIRLVRQVLTGDRYRLVEGHNFEVDGIPASHEQAEELFRRDPFQFQHWFVERLGGFPMKKKVADRGIDGRMYFETKGELREMIISVKGGTLHPSDLRDLRGVIDREGAKMGALLTLREPTRGMRSELAQAGSFEHGGVDYPRLQILTVRDVFENKRDLLMPSKVTSKANSDQWSLPL